jgi:hypothetical protein
LNGKDVIKPYFNTDLRKLVKNVKMRMGRRKVIKERSKKGIIPQLISTACYFFMK